MKHSNLFSKIITHLKNQRWFYLLMGLAVLVRVSNLHHTLYFTWDQGRDAWVLQRLLDGDLTLIGPTSGLHGFFLGPLWYYLGAPGMLLAQGNPYGISLWYIFLGILALPLMCLLSLQLFPQPKDRHWAILTAFLLMLLPGSVKGGTFIWNPLISLPLVTGATYALLRARESRLWLGLSFFLWALTLQSEFAYAVFFLVPLWLLIPWIRKEWSWRDFVLSALAVGITLLPQLAFEIRNQFIMTQSLIRSLVSPELVITWSHHFSRRPQQLWSSTQELFVLTGSNRSLMMGVVFIAILSSLILIWTTAKKKPFYGTFSWRMLSLLAIIPYVFYLFWRGNYGNFFSYYLTPHFILLVPLVVLALRQLSQVRFGRITAAPLAWFVVGSLAFVSFEYSLRQMTLRENRAGLASMIQAVDQLYEWKHKDNAPNESQAFRIFTPNAQTEHYDYLVHWRAKQKQYDIPPTVKTADTKIWYILVEPDRQLPEQRFIPWYQEATAGGNLTRKTEVGALSLETWSLPSETTVNSQPL